MPDSTRRPKAATALAADASAFPAISDAEWEVMKVVWDRGPLAAGEVVRHLAESPPGHPARRWRPRTVKTLLSRLVGKGAVAADAGADEASAGGRRFLYAARVARDRVVRQESRSFLARVFDGSVAPALLHFLADARLTPDEVAQLRRTLDGQPAAGDASAGRSPSGGTASAAEKSPASGRPRR